MLLALIITLAGLNAGPIVVPADPIAAWKGDGTALKFDPACRDYTVETVKSDPACAARVERGEAAPSIAIAIRTIATSPRDADAAIKILERSAKVTDNPAVHAMLGVMLGNADRVQPNYDEAVRQLTIAAGRGNPDSADLLASLIVAGKGAARDMPRAIKLYEQAAANGYPEAAVTLGKLHLGGRFVPKDVVRGRAWLDAAAAAGVVTATNLASMAANDDKFNNMQLIPASEPDTIRTVRYGTFDNPEIPPSFGFDPAFQAVHDAPYDDAATLARLDSGAVPRPTPYLYELARRLAARDPQRAMVTYLLARTRMRYDASRCADPMAMEALRAWDMLLGPDIKFLFTERPGVLVLKAALDTESKLPADTPPWWVCRSGMAAMAAALSGRPGPLQLKPIADWPPLRAASRAPLMALIAAP